MAGRLPMSRDADLTRQQLTGGATELRTKGLLPDGGQRPSCWLS
jgi:hypothetical protein